MFEAMGGKDVSDSALDVQQNLFVILVVGQVFLSFFVFVPPPLESLGILQLLIALVLVQQIN